MAYLVPLALTAQRNGITVGVATKTNALLDQLVFKEVPALAKALRASDSDCKAFDVCAVEGILPLSLPSQDSQRG